MNFGALLTQVYRTLQDPAQKAWPNSAVAIHATEAVRRVGDMTPTSGNRASVNLEQGIQEYLLPSNVRRLVSVKLIPREGGEPGPALINRDFSDIPVDATEEGEPDRYALRSTAGTLENELALFLWRAPDRSATDAIILDIRDDFFLTSADPAAGGDLTQNIPYPTKFDLPIVWLTCGGLLRERDDENDIRKGEQFIAWAEDKLASYIPLEALNFTADVNRAFP